MKWSSGDKVMAKWPGSALYFPAIVKSLDEDNDSVDVLFEDGSEMTVPIKSLRTEQAFRRKRSKSPARSRRRSRSPGRSPGRKPKSSVVVDGGERKVRTRTRSTQRIVSSSSSSDEKKLTVTVKSIDHDIVTAGSVITTKSKTLIDDSPMLESRYRVTRQRAKMLETGSAKIEPTAISTPSETEYGGVLGVFCIYLTTPLLPLVVLLICNKDDCSISKFNLNMIPCRLEDYYDQTSVMIFFAFLLFHAVIYALPLGFIMRGPDAPNGKKMFYRISAMYSLILTLGAYALMHYLDFPFHAIREKMFTLAATASVFSYLAVIVFYLKSLRVPKDELNPKANTGSHIYDSFVGHELHPRVGKYFDWKLFLYRPAMAGWLVIVMLLMHQEYKTTGNLPRELWIVGVSQIIYCILEFFWDEMQCPFMFDIKNEGLGFVQWYGELVLVPFVYTLPVLYASYHSDDITNVRAAGAVAMIVVGMYFIVVAGRQKNKFRINPYDQSLAHLDSLPASKVNGQRLLISGLWGFVRHPNYLGEILVGLGWSLACGFDHLLPWYYPVFVTVLLCHRALRLDQRSSEKHGIAWKTYCQKVKYRVIPCLF